MPTIIIFWQVRRVHDTQALKYYKVKSIKIALQCVSRGQVGRPWSLKCFGCTSHHDILKQFNPIFGGSWKKMSVFDSHFCKLVFDRQVGGYGLYVVVVE